ncbi:methionine ABC transporter ATP-binding protein [Haematomicrobium sanguinis]|uniref:methionine ABC transporter ATP-binding protein n=1 Tax=Haematomicrobium sanguinis TaxID=479106 RepID=UPI00094959AE|nr:ATP-binding cassette domain-containing protein [Haematomicrobium sanguinis]
MISVTDLRKVYRSGATDIVALDGVDLEVGAGRIHGIIGPSGAGKSTLVRCLTLLERPTSGTVSIDGVDLAGVRDSQLRAARRRLGMVFQHANLMDSRTAAQNVAHPLEIVGVPRADISRKVAELLDLVGLAGFAESYPSQLSGGQKQRVGIARALANDPHVLLCDEPTSALDPSTTGEILDLLRSLRERLGITVLIITHEMSVVKSLCDSVSLLSAGKIAQSGDITEVAADFGSPLSEALLPLPVLDPSLDSASALEVLYSGSEAAEPQFARLMRESGVDVNILAGTVEQLGGQTFGHFYIDTPAETSPEKRARLEQVLGEKSMNFRAYRAHLSGASQLAEEVAG